MIHSRSVFDPVAAEYDTARPSYPAELVDLLDDVVGGLRGRDVLDLAAGTGILTRALADRGARVVAADPGAAMLQQLRSHHPRAPAVLAVAEALPFAPASFDLVTCATGWHWIDAELGCRQVRRVLRPAGALALLTTREQPNEQDWRRWQGEVLTGAGVGQIGTRDLSGHDDLRGYGFLRSAADSVEWARDLTVTEQVRVLGTHSPVLALGDRRTEVLDTIAAGLAQRCPSGVVEVCYRTELVVWTPGSAGRSTCGR